MLAQHPLTGKPIRVMKSSAQLWKEAKTLVLLSPDADPAVPWDRWETAAVGFSTVKALRAKGITVHIPVFIDEVDLTLSDLKQQSELSHIICISMRIIQQLGAKEFQDAKIGNVVCLEEFKNLYSYCGEIWNGTGEDAAALICATLHFSRLAGVAAEALTHRKERLDAMNIELIGSDAKPSQLWLIQQYYRPEKTKRAREIRRCLDENVKCELIDKILLLNEEDFSKDFPKGSEQKIQQMIVGKRLTYEMVIRTIYDSVPPNVIVVFSNSDIYLDESMRNLWTLKLEDKFLSLLRYDVPEDESVKPQLFGPRDDSQDTWIVSSTSVQSRAWKWEDLAFPFGKNGCDNAISLEMLRQKFLIANPAYSLKTLHVHSSGYRTYNPKDVVDKPVFLHIAPSGLNDFYAKDKFEAKDILRKIPHKPFYRELRSVQEKEIRTFCAMLKRNEEYIWTHDSKNIFTPASDTVLGFHDSFLTYNGLPYGHHELYMGQSKLSQELWSKTGISGCQPCIGSDLAYAAPLTDRVTISAENFCLFYISKILQIRDLPGEFICPQKEDFLKVLQLFRWEKREIPVLPSDPAMGIYSQKSIVWECSDNTQLTCEDIRALRDNLNISWETQKPVSKKITIIEDGTILDSQWIAEFEEQLGAEWDVNVIWPGRTSLERIVNLLRNTEILVYGNGEKLLKTWSWMWILPEGARAIEIQNEMDPRGDAIHMAGACQINHWMLIMRKGLREPMIKDTVKNALKTLEAMTTGSTKDLKKDVLWLPRSDIKGFFGHTGDSFREMARMWGERGYCQVKEHPVATLCWYSPGGGDIDDPSSWLLYDRPNLDWLWTSTEIEQAWKKGLFGNPEPPKGGKSWSFWPRRPRLVEEIVGRGLPSAGWDGRQKNLVFYGKVENRVQELRRSGSWSSVCDEFIMPHGEDAKYPFSQEEYLIRLTQARYGLCLAGFGRKCHREVECMAMGCVPIVDKEVDMTSYANPPVEGVHFLRVEKPEEVSQKIAELDKSTWAKMSAACRQWWTVNASCKGMYDLTKQQVSEA